MGLTLTADEVRAMGAMKFYELTGYDTSIFDQAAKSGYMDPASISFNGNTGEIIYNADKPMTQQVRVKATEIDNAGILDPKTRTVTVTKTTGSAPTVLKPAASDIQITQAALNYAGLADAANAMTPAAADAQTPGSAPVYYGPGTSSGDSTVAAPRGGLSPLVIGAVVVAGGLVAMSFLPKGNPPAQPAKTAAPPAVKGAA